MITKLLQTDLYELLLKSESEQKFFFESKDKTVTVLGLGPTEKIAFKDGPNFLNNNPHLLLWASMSFEKTDHSAFYASYLTLIKKDGQISAQINPHLICDIATLFKDTTLESPNRETTTQLTPNFNEWQTMLNSALELLAEKKLLKVVLKRKKIIHFESNICPLNIFQKAYLRESQNYNIFVQENSHKAFISFTPEKLFSLENNSTIETISLAGSAPRGNSDAQDTTLENELISSTKLIHEQKIVTDEIANRLASLADGIKISNLEILKLRYIQHRANKISAKLNEEKNFLDLIITLHPTPAVGGAPNKTALAAISALEQDERNNFAAPVGFATLNYSEWAVGLRSASIEANAITIYAGCGIVTGSGPQAEWDEAETKMRPFLKALQAEHSYV